MNVHFDSIRGFVSLFKSINVFHHYEGKIYCTGWDYQNRMHEFFIDASSREAFEAACKDQVRLVNMR